MHMHGAWVTPPCPFFAAPPRSLMASCPPYSVYILATGLLKPFRRDGKQIVWTCVAAGSDAPGRHHHRVNLLLHVSHKVTITPSDVE